MPTSDFNDQLGPVETYSNSPEDTARSTSASATAEDSSEQPVDNNAGLEPDSFDEWAEFLAAQGIEHRDNLFRFGRTIGFDFLGFILASADFVDVVPTDAQRSVIAELADAMDELELIPDQNTRRVRTVRHLCGYQPDLGTSRATHWHKRCGGIVPERTDDDSAENLLSILVEDVLGSLLIEPQSHISAVLERHPAYSGLMHVLHDSDDEGLAALFERAYADAEAAGLRPFAHTARAAAVDATWTTPGLNPMQYHQIPWALLANIHVANYDPGNIVGPAQTAVLQNLKLARELSRGQTVEVPTYVGITGIRLPDTAEPLALSGVGTLRRSNPLDPGCLNGATQIWTILTIDTPCRLVSAELRQPPLPGEDPLPNFDAPKVNPQHQAEVHAIRESLAVSTDRLRFAFMLATDDEAPPATRVAFAVTMNPLVETASQRLDLPHNSHAHTLEDASTARLLYWLPKALALPQRLELGMRRLLRAAADREDPADALIDSIIAWENILGANPEIKFRTTAAMALLIEPNDPLRREALMQELSDLYNRRSELVHGSKEVGARNHLPIEIQTNATRALRVGIDVYRKVLDSADLTQIAKPDERSKKILLRL